MKSLTDAIKAATLAPRNDNMLHFSQHLNHDRHTVLYWHHNYPAVLDQPWMNTVPLLQGNAIHNEVHKIMEDNHTPYVCERQILAEDEYFQYPWGGTADAYTEDEQGKVWLLDYKTISGAGLTFLDEPKPEHLIQVSCYYHFDTIKPDKVGILYLPVSADYKRRWSEPIFFEVTPLPKDIIISKIQKVEQAIKDYAIKGILPDPPIGTFHWKQNKRNKYWELNYKPNYTNMYCPWRTLDDDPCGCSKESAQYIGRVDYEYQPIEGDEEILRYWSINIPRSPDESA